MVFFRGVSLQTPPYSTQNRFHELSSSYIGYKALEVLQTNNSGF
jgi:hypothetical protein